jgi:Cd2+/Zn2+-exporting ATPase
MLTGDTPGAARALAGRLGLDEVRAGLLPEDKLAAVQALVARHGVVAMVGDGVNDAPALAASGLGVALGAAGSDAAIETADVVIMSDDLSRLPWLVRHSRRTVATIRANIAVSLAIKAAFIGLALLGWASLWGAIAADMGVSLLVVANAMRLLRASAPPAAQTP